MESERSADKNRTRVWFDTEFMEDGRTIELLSIGAVRQDGACFYAESLEADHSKANEWVKANVLPKMVHGPSKMPRHLIAESFRNFCGERPEIWGYYADYDWVVLCQLFGRMVDLPKGWPMFCRDVKQLCIERGDPRLPKNEGAHHALADAKWVREAWEFLQRSTPTAELCRPRSGYELLTREQIEAHRLYLRRAMERLGRKSEPFNEKLCDMAVNALLYAEEIDRLRGATTPSAGGDSDLCPQCGLLLPGPNVQGDHCPGHEARYPDISEYP